MSKKSKVSRSPGMKEVSRRFKKWRKSKQKRNTPIPEELWEAAVELAEQEGVYAVTRELRLDYNRLKKSVKPLVERKGQKVQARGGGTVSFVEVKVPEVARAGQCPKSETVIELCGADGAHLRIHHRGDEPVDVVGLVTSLWRRSPCSR